MNQALRITLAYICAPYIAMTGNGFDSKHRHNDTIIYRMIDTVAANQIAIAISPFRR